MVDPIADMLTRIRNAGMARHATTRIPLSKVKVKLAELMKSEGFISGFSFDQDKEGHREIVVDLRYVDEFRPAIHIVKRVSKPGCRVYRKIKEVQQVKAGLGVAILSTSRGILSDREARKLNVGGEVICEIW